jgi:hypothetical protein
MEYPKYVVGLIYVGDVEEFWERLTGETYYTFHGSKERMTLSELVNAYDEVREVHWGDVVDSPLPAGSLVEVSDSLNGFPVGVISGVIKSYDPETEQYRVAVEVNYHKSNVRKA